MTIPPSKAACSIPCNLCGGQEVEEVSLRDRDGRYLRTVICRQCGLLWTDPRPASVEIQNYYAHDYRLDYKATYSPQPKHVYRAGRVAIDRCTGLKGLLKPGESVLDLGAGAGELVYFLRRLGYDASGIEPNEGYARFAAEILSLPVSHGFYQGVEITPEAFQAVLMYHVLEHLEDPLDAVSHARKWLKAGGLLVVEVPNAEAACQWPGHRFHRAHLYSFNPAALEHLLQKAGYAIRDRHLSSDGGNVTVVGEKGAPPGNSPMAQIEGNYERVITVLRRHTNLRHLLSGYPFQRVFSKLGQHLHEFCQTRGRRAGREILDDLVREAFGIEPQSPRG